MAQNNRPDKGKQSRNKKPEKPYVEQIDELLLVHNIFCTHFFHSA